jgi:malonate transporter MadM subunit
VRSWACPLLSRGLTRGRIHASAIAILGALLLAWIGGELTGGKKGLADVSGLGGLALMGGAMLRDFAIVATAFEVDVVRRARPDGWA